jgi:hypothetical protein
VPGRDDENSGLGPKGYYGAAVPLLIDIKTHAAQRCIISRAFFCVLPGIPPLGFYRWTVMTIDTLENVPELSVPTDKLCYIIAKAKEFDAKDVLTDPDDASNASDDGMVSVLEDHNDDPVVQEIRAAIFAMSEDEQIDLVALAWLGRGDGTIEDWDDLRAEAARARNKRTASYLLGMPMLGDYLEEAMSQFGLSCNQ